ncbi:MAG: ABC transporter [Curvibacter sp. RIFCSPHIGHO2_12_FULL_63_18]|uniref:ABC transporter ATP-binding protein n=1 Tax=Rhodoferax sp. TaxID=50421 RepID=UPI0008AD026D|nr:sn-glycerol-3-phosphate ABC transporter ATP-binding protein UgpC [Rhodoferax sp.]OGO94753.1 MAG: ABC transporter [Curvibacter sp. GWA2_63_95]OGP06847.1 MAG: ABC transporter [Curvibacter sp. RIFCSPHIGHO2_12_FULL_63_18]HCX80252.1 ABC transporter [Rhodoferax sp.]
MARVSLKNISKSYGSNDPVLHNISLDIEHGELVVLVGPSGCGKSTLLRVLCGLEDISSGELRIGDDVVNDLPPAERGIAMVFQSYALYPHMDVYRNMSFGLKIHGATKADIDKKVRDAAKVLHIDHLLDRLPRELSGGQRQRVAIGRAIVREPRLFLFDEPLSNLDAALRAKTRIELARLHRDLDATMVYVTHDQVEAMTLGDKIVVLSEGHVQQAGTPLTLYQQPANRFVATFIGSPTINLLPARVIEVSDLGARLQLGNGSKVLATVDASQLQVGETVEVGLRPEHCEVLPAGVAPGADDTALDAEITLVEHLGESNLLYLKMDDGQELIVRGDGNAEVRLGDSVIVRAAPSALYLFKADGTACTRLHPGNMRSAHAL